MDVAMQNPNNPYIQNMAQMAFKAGQLASDDYFKRQQIDIARSKANAKGSTLIPEGFFDGEGDGVPKSYVPNTAEVIAKNNDATSEEQQKVVAGATVPKDNVQLQPGQKLRDASFLQKYGLPVESIVGPSVYDKSQVDSVTKSLSSRGASISQVRKNVTQNKEIAQAFDKDFTSLTEADRLLQSDSQMQDLLSQSGNNIFNIQASQVPSMTGGKDRSYVAKIGNNKPVDITEDQYKAIIAIKGAGAGVRAYGGSLVSKQEDRPTQTQGGLPAVQVQSTIPEIPEEARGLQQIVEQGQTAKAQEAAKNVEARINDIDSQIKRLSSSTAAPQTRLQSEGTMPLRSKTPQQAQADIEKIAQLKKQKRVLQGKYETPQEVGEAVQSGLLTRDQALSILRNQFKM
jgi:hypothetical protein